MSQSPSLAALIFACMLIVLAADHHNSRGSAQVLVTDTAGVHAAGGEVEAEGVRRALAAAAAADIVAIVADAVAHPAIAAAAALTAQHGRNCSPEDELGGQLNSRPGAAARGGRIVGGANVQVQQGQGDGAAAAGSAQSAEARIRAACRGLFADFPAAALPASECIAAGEPGPRAGQPAAQAPPFLRVEHEVAPAIAVPQGSVLQVLLGRDELGPSMPAGELDEAVAGVGTLEGCAAVPAQQVLLVANKWDLVKPKADALRDAETQISTYADPGSAPASKNGHVESDLLGLGFPKPEADQARWRACAVSCRTGEGMDALLAELRAAVSTVVGGGGAVDDAALVTRYALLLKRV